MLDIDLPWLDELVRAKGARRLPKVLTREEVQAILGQLSGTRWLLVSLLYGAGLRLNECLSLRVKDVETTLVYTHLMNSSLAAVRSPADALPG